MRILISISRKVSQVRFSKNHRITEKQKWSSNQTWLTAGWQPSKTRSNANSKKNFDDFSHYWGKIEMFHEEFDTKSSQYKVNRFLFLTFFLSHSHIFSISLFTFHLSSFLPFFKIFKFQDFSWEGQGFSLMNRYFPHSGDQLEKLFNETINLTDNLSAISCHSSLQNFSEEE